MSLNHNTSPFTCQRLSGLPCLPSRESSILRKFSCASVTEVSSPGDLTTNVSSECLGRELTLASSLSVDVNTVAGYGWIPLEGIWSKAAELLKTEGAIISAPGVGSGAKFAVGRGALSQAKERECICL